MDGWADRWKDGCYELHYLPASFYTVDNYFDSGVVEPLFTISVSHKNGVYEKKLSLAFSGSAMWYSLIIKLSELSCLTLVDLTRKHSSVQCYANLCKSVNASDPLILHFTDTLVKK